MTDLYIGGVPLSSLPNTYAVGISAGCSTFANAVTTIGATPATLVIPSGNHVGGGVTVPATLALKFMKNGIITVANGATCTIGGYIEAGPYQIFALTGTGVIAFASGHKINRAYFEWWGVVGDGSTDDATALQAAITACAISTAGIPIIALPFTTYHTHSELTLYDRTQIYGGINTTLQAGAAMDAVMTYSVGDYGNQHICLRDLVLDGNSNATNCFYGYKISMSNFTALDGILAKNATAEGIKLEACQGGVFRSIKALTCGTYGVSLLGCSASKFYGLTAIDCTSHGLYVSISGSYSGGCAIYGLHVEGNDGHGIYLNANTTGVKIIGGWAELNTLDTIRINSSGNYITGLYATAVSTYVASPGACTAVQSGDAGVVTAGDHIIKITYITPSGESGLGTASGTVAADGSHAIDLSAIPVHGTAGIVTARKIYMTKAGGSTYYYIATLSNNSTTTYQINVADASLTVEGPTSNATTNYFCNIISGGGNVVRDNVGAVSVGSTSWYPSTDAGTIAYNTIGPNRYTSGEPFRNAPTNSFGFTSNSAATTRALLQTENGGTFVMTASSPNVVHYDLPTGDLAAYHGFQKSPLKYTFVKYGSGDVVIDPGTNNFIYTGTASQVLSNTTDAETCHSVTVMLISSASSVNKWAAIAIDGTWALS